MVMNLFKRKNRIQAEKHIELEKPQALPKLTRQPTIFIKERRNALLEGPVEEKKLKSPREISEK